jgi:hypothetical protein
LKTVKSTGWERKRNPTFKILPFAISRNIYNTCAICIFITR